MARDQYIVVVVEVSLVKYLVLGEMPASKKTTDCAVFSALYCASDSCYDSSCERAYMYMWPAVTLHGAFPRGEKQAYFRVRVRIG